jgi:hypothetical protein
LVIDRETDYITYSSYELRNPDIIRLLNKYYAEKNYPGYIYYDKHSDTVIEKMGNIISINHLT